MFQKDRIMEKIELTELEERMLAANVEREFSPMTATEEECEAMNSVIAKAEALAEELNAWDNEIDDDLMKWFQDKYRAQQASAD